ncbi:hypothetical protein JHK85_044496 [Glycine max]|nr:hypothetical protein JHK86_043828 [Glycine max]KAG4958116.1 hypothetical protein JHK85_044496 [Glycine max]
MAGLVAQVQSSPCTSTFFSALVQLIPCRAAVAPFSPIPPSDSCCNALKALGQPCLCVLVNGPPISGVDRNMASQLPDKCTANFEPLKDSISFNYWDPRTDQYHAEHKKITGMACSLPNEGVRAQTCAMNMELLGGSLAYPNEKESHLVTCALSYVIRKLYTALTRILA